ncbi:MAG TPA: pyridine nucleotide-disulfide oxidoreductase [Methylophaga sp.]|jgi:sulfide:quinone oxidoreductase|uniref:NAD(P)/FAD-dependent oxidoreductase n=1 Tax=unclassified Methylophaga TaxID=2629249 RepID=UPI000C97E634|nr:MULTISPECIES: FAD/NAD(P)-binding oxidoreductase [unclassified Methylophaga]MAP26119.1 pyridine nucleotide-disulfide oxidoreductase [Methylophaga sp.]HAD32140.1 pyridine nucleotide-disulfide oxidoreductase [Methylophaga sp.]|tara:strand:- start:116133 stop:117404 length:1272 start_codon:yes stop_codon:yes gene_type:complete
MAHIVIIGASTGGLPAAYECRSALDKKHHISVVSNTPIFHFVPSNPWVAVGWRKREDISFKLASVLSSKNIDFYDSGVAKIKPATNQVLLGDNTILNYDFLIVATGAKLAFDEIEGFGPHAHTHSICTVDHAEDSYRAWREFLKNPGPIVVGAVQGASCFGPAYEFAFIMNRALRKAKVRDRVPMTFVTPEPYIGHMGLGGVGDSKGLFESEFRKNDIKWITNARVKSIANGKMLVEQVDDNAETFKTHQLAFDYSMLIPAFKGVDCVANLNEELVNPRGFLKVDEFQRNPVYPNIYGVGVCVAIPPVEATPLPVGVPKTGYMIESMAKAAVANIQAAIVDRPIQTRASLNAVCLADMGHTGAAFVALPQIPPRNLAWMKKGRWVQLAKIAFEKYFLFRMKRGLPESFYERCLLRCFGISKTK